VDLRKILVYGLGRTNESLLNELLKEPDSKIYFASDGNDCPDFSSNLEIISREEVLKRDFDQIYVTPGIPARHPVYLKPNVSNEIQYALGFTKAKVIGVTGSNGKSSTCKLIAQYLSHLGFKVVLGGNFGVSLTSQLEDLKQADFVVVEFSSFQLHVISGQLLDVAFFTSFEENHLDWHGDVESYLSDKSKIFEITKMNSLLMAPLELKHRLQRADLSFVSLSASEDADVCWDGKTIIFNQGENYELNFENRPTAISWLFLLAMLRHFNLEEPNQTEFVFETLSHRLEIFHKNKHTYFVNDSKSTTPGATIHALNSLEFQNGILILGGKDKGIDLEDFFEALKSFRDRISCLVLYGYLTEYSQRLSQKGFNVLAAEKWDKAMENLLSVYDETVDCVLLSPASSSLDQFSSFEKRGEVFKEYAQKI
jgi:UDP-N-acetylmuramoylalanine--D-glutamate ligase